MAEGKISPPRVRVGTRIRARARVRVRARGVDEEAVFRLLCKPRLLDEGGLARRPAVDGTRPRLVNSSSTPRAWRHCPAAPQAPMAIVSWELVMEPGETRCT